MRHETETMREILTSQTGQDFADQVAPIYGESRVALWLYQVMGVEWEQARRLCQEFALQIVPQTATWALDFWELQYGIRKDPAMSPQQRRDRILSCRRDRAPMNPYTLGQIASVAAANAQATIEENTGPYEFTVWLSAVPDLATERKIVEAVERAKPAHLSFVVKYEQYDLAAAHVGGAVQMGYAMTIRQV